MNNSVGSGNPINLTLAGTVAAGSGVLVGSIFGVTTIDGVSGDSVPAHTVGEFELPKLTTDNVTQGLLLYWDNTNKRLTITSTSNTLVGTAAKAAGTTATKVVAYISPCW